MSAVYGDWDAYPDDSTLDPIPPVRQTTVCRPCLGTGVMYEPHRLNGPIRPPVAGRFTYGCTHCGQGHK